MKRILREPLLHFALLGAALFVLFGAVGRSEVGHSERIVVTGAQIEQLVQVWQRTWQRPPTREELEGLIEDHVREEVFYREALALGLDQNDTIIRRRLRQKLEFVAEDIAAIAEPNDDELRAFLQRRAESFRVPTRLSFEHIYFSVERRGARAAEEAERILADLRTGRAEPRAVGDPFALALECESVSESDVRNQFGDEFAALLLAAEEGVWTGPMKSAYGLHLVRVRQRIPARLPDLDEVRSAVVREWTVWRRQEADAAFYGRLRDRYTILIDRPDDLSQESISPEDRS